MIISDSREKKNQHILDYFNQHNIEYKIIALEIIKTQTILLLRLTEKEI